MQPRHLHHELTACSSFQRCLQILRTFSGSAGSGRTSRVAARFTFRLASKALPEPTQSGTDCSNREKQHLSHALAIPHKLLAHGHLLHDSRAIDFLGNLTPCCVLPELVDATADQGREGVHEERKEHVVQLRDHQEGNQYLVSDTTIYQPLLIKQPLLM